uniref:Transmembrane protein 126A n=1 Tax=Oncorhynchus tshawytscha TaxID=74940 RepID=A0AAZ3Q434_ONCTS
VSLKTTIIHLFQPSVIVQMIVGRFERLPELDRYVFVRLCLDMGKYSPMAPSYTGALNVTQGRFTSYLPMAVLPFLTTVAMYDVAVSKPFIVWWVGALVSAVGAGIYPILLALPVNAGLANCLSRKTCFWMNITQPILRIMGVVIVLQVLFGTYLGSRHFDS